MNSIGPMLAYGFTLNWPELLRSLRDLHPYRAAPAGDNNAFDAGKMKEKAFEIPAGEVAVDC